MDTCFSACCNATTDKLQHNVLIDQGFLFNSCEIVKEYERVGAVGNPVHHNVTFVPWTDYVNFYRM